MDNYSTMKLEMLGLKWAVTEKFRDYLLGSECTVYTDNNPLSYLQTSTRLGATEMRWAAELAQFQLNIKVKDRVCFAPVFITYNKLYMYIASIFGKTSVTSVLYH